MQILGKGRERERAREKERERDKKRHETQDEVCSILKTVYLFLSP